MLHTPTKRHASRSPSGAKSLKRAQTSSPEEGEVDDASPPLISQPLPASLPARPVSPSRLPGKTKVPFPFKKKVELTRSGGRNHSVTSESRDKSAPIVYERSEEDERRIREADHSRRGTRSQSRRSQPVSNGDHWEPGATRSRDFSVAHGIRNSSAFPTRDGDHYSSRDRLRDRSDRRDWDYAPHSGSRVDQYRPRSLPSPLSRSRSRSPSSSSTERGKHRLPPPRSPDFSPPHRNYGLDRQRDRDRGAWDRDPRSFRDDAESAYSRNDHRSHARDWHQEGGDYHRDDPDDRRYRPSQFSPHHDYRRHRERSPRSESHDIGRQSRDVESYRDLDSYRPTSPRPSSYTSRSRITPPPGSFSPPTTAGIHPSQTPPPPPVSPPPPPPPIDFGKDASLPLAYAVVSIPLKRPGAPRDVHSPPSLPLPTPAAEQHAELAPPPIVVTAGNKRTPVQRSSEEEELAYGRVFKGCSRKDNYEVTMKLGEGTFGEVHKAIQKDTGKAVALKRILMHHEKEGMPVTALREIKILKALSHPSIVDILDMFVVRSTSKDPLSVYMVFPYMDHDLAGLLENERVKLQPSHIKLYMKQLLEGTEYMHRNHILHRDMKAANLLISNTGSLRIADFGLARAFDNRNVDHRGKERKYTNCVVTRWYRPPELLLGARQYGGEVDIWGIGCVLGEMFTRRPILPGTSDLDQLSRIWQLCGTPNQHTWPNYDALPGCDGVKRFSPNHSRRLRSQYESIGPETVDLMDKLLTCNPRQRITASQALDHEYFWTDPLPADPKSLPTYEASHEYDKRGRRPPPTGPSNMPPPTDGQPRQPVMQGPPLHFGRGGPPPHRDAFRTGPPQHYPYVPNHPNHHIAPPAQYPPPPNLYPQRASNGQPHVPYRPGSHPPVGPHRQERWEHKDRPMHLPPRPPAPMGRGRDGFGGDRGGPPSSSDGAELNYG